MEGGLSLAPTAMPGFVASLLADKQGAYALIYRRRNKKSWPLFGEEAVAKLEGGRLESDKLERSRRQDAKSTNMRIRRSGSSAPTSTNPWRSGQPSADGILLCGFRTTHTVRHCDVGAASRPQGKGAPLAPIPATDKRTPESPLETDHSWTFAATCAREGIVGGAWPWMRQGWLLLEDYYDKGSALIDPQLFDAASAISPSRFVTLRKEGAALLADRFGLAVRKDQ